jgi:hypothetical protein
MSDTATNPETLAGQWQAAKAAETAAIDRRRKIEDDLVKAFDVREDMEGTEHFAAGILDVKIVGRMTRKVDSDRLLEIAAEHGLSEHLSRLFRWTPELNVKVWDSSDKAITAPLLGAITTKPGRPSFTITTKE